MSKEYDLYLDIHKENVRRAFLWFKENLPEVIPTDDGVDYEHQICFMHDWSKAEPDEYDAYDVYFYGGNKSFEVVQNYRYAWLYHLNKNPHHWQHWVLINDDQEEGEIILDMPYHYILEMLCDWWSFSWSRGELGEIFPWYEGKRNYIKLSPAARKTLEGILDKMKKKLGISIESEE